MQTKDKAVVSAEADQNKDPLQFYSQVSDSLSGLPGEAVTPVVSALLFKTKGRE